MDVVLVGSYPPPHGGQSVHIENLARFLRRESVGVRIINTGADKSLRDEGLTSVGSAWQLFRELRVGSTPSVLHVHVTAPTDFGKIFPVALVAALRQIPWIATIHSGDTRDRLVRAGSLRRFMARALLKRAAAVICVSAAVGDAVEALVGRTRIDVISPHSVDSSAAKSPRAVTEFIERHTPTLACIGQFEPTYGFDDAVRLMSELVRQFPTAGLLLIGNAERADATRRLIASLGLEQSVSICGNLTHDECLGAIKAVTVFLRPTLYDGDALSVREAMALGVPVVATATDFRPDGVVTYRRDVAGELLRKVVATLEARGTHDAGSLSAESRNLDRVRQVYRRAAKP